MIETTRNTAQRKIILDHMLLVRNHPTAEMVYGSVKTKLPHVSKATVYRNLNLLAEKGVIRRIEQNGEYRYDSNPTPHQHLVEDGVIHDIPDKKLSALAIEELRRQGYECERVENHIHWQESQENQHCRGENMIPIGTKIPDFEMDAYHDDEFKKVKLSDFKGKWLVMLFYPADFTFVCPTELEEAADHYDEIKAIGGQLVSISTDTHFVHKAWHDHSPSIKKITYPMLADPTGNISRAFGTYIEQEGLSQRATFIIDPDGALKAMDIHDNSIGRSTKEIIRKLQAAIYVHEHHGEVCPASWFPGKKTLKPGAGLVGKI